MMPCEACGTMTSNGRPGQHGVLCDGCEKIAKYAPAPYGMPSTELSAMMRHVRERVDFVKAVLEMERGHKTIR